MKTYELLTVFKPNLDAEEVDKLIAKMNETIVGFGGKVASTDKIGRKKLAYDIQNFRDGFLVSSNLELPADKVAEFKRQLRLSDNIIRTMFMAAQSFPPYRNGSKSRKGIKCHFIRVVSKRTSLDEIVSTLDKGDNVLVEGRLQTAAVKMDDGTEKRIYEIDANAIERMGEGGSGSVSSGSSSSSGKFGTEEIVKFESDDFSNELIGEDEIPFQRKRAEGAARNDTQKCVALESGDPLIASDARGGFALCRTKQSSELFCERGRNEDSPDSEEIERG